MTTHIDQRFSVDTEGMRQLNADRKPWTLVKELIQNSWDEFPNATTCRVEVQSSADTEQETVVVVEDNGGGFADIRDAYTLMAPTAKRLDPAKRGRFNLGEKEIMSVALSGEIETVGQTVMFPAEGGREVNTNSRTSGTKISAVMPWSQAQRSELVESLKRFIPNGCGLVVNGQEVRNRSAVIEFTATLPTVLQDAPGSPMRPTSRKTKVSVYEPYENDTGWLYEMGIPIQPIDCRWDVDIHQKVPLPPNRDTVGRAYLKSISAEVLNETHHLLEEDRFADTWVRTAMEDKRINSDAVKTAAAKRYGEKTLIWSNDANANMRAVDMGYQLVHPRSMSPEERHNIKTLGGIQTAREVFGRDTALSFPAEMNDTRRKFAEWVKEIAIKCGMTGTCVQFFYCDKTNTAAMCSGDSEYQLVSFNASILTDEWFSQRGVDQISLIIHELAHASSEGEMSHGPSWGEECCRLAGIISEGHI